MGRQATLRRMWVAAIAVAVTGPVVLAQSRSDGPMPLSPQRVTKVASADDDWRCVTTPQNTLSVLELPWPNTDGHLSLKHMPNLAQWVLIREEQILPQIAAMQRVSVKRVEVCGDLDMRWHVHVATVRMMC